MTKRQIFRRLNGAALLCVAAFFLYAYYIQYFKWRDCFNDQGRCFDSETSTVYLEQSGPIWLGIGLLTLGFALWLLRPNRRSS